MLPHAPPLLTLPVGGRCCIAGRRRGLRFLGGVYLGMGGAGCVVFAEKGGCVLQGEDVQSLGCKDRGGHSLGCKVEGRHSLGCKDRGRHSLGCKDRGEHSSGQEGKQSRGQPHRVCQQQGCSHAGRHQSVLR